MRIAILFSGRIQQFERCYYNILKYIKINDNNEIDFFLSHSPDLNEDLESFKKIFKPKLMINEPITYFDHTKYPKYCHYQGHNTMCMFINRLRVFKLLETFINTTPTSYDLVISYRTETILNKNLNFQWFNQLNENTIYIPEGNDWWGGLNDQLAFGTYDSMKIYLSLYEELKQMLDNGCVFHPETILRHYLNIKNINVIRIPLEYKLVL
uniref:Glycosyltransferase n=1 Tax=viral metagenome TaxID=1070528 RepID=A0A6C0HDE5_9ZZZZ